MNSIAEENQLLFTIIGMAVLFVLVFWNNSRNKKQRNQRRSRNFKDRYRQRKEQDKNQNK